MNIQRGLVLATLGLASLNAPANDYPTEARVQYVVECMAKHGGADYGRMYQCSCSVDHVASVLPYNAFVEADTYKRGQRAAGERGGILREGPRARELRSTLADAQEAAERKCFPGNGDKQISSK